jgi:hypothetical protein
MFAPNGLDDLEAVFAFRERGRVLPHRYPSLGDCLIILRGYQPTRGLAESDISRRQKRLSKLGINMLVAAHPLLMR